LQLNLFLRNLKMNLIKYLGENEINGEPMYDLEIDFEIEAVLLEFNISVKDSIRFNSLSRLVILLLKKSHREKILLPAIENIYGTAENNDQNTYYFCNRDFNHQAFQLIIKLSALLLFSWDISIADQTVASIISKDSEFLEFLQYWFPEWFMWKENRPFCVKQK